MKCKGRGLARDSTSALEGDRATLAGAPRAPGRAREVPAFFKRRERAHREPERCLFTERASHDARERACETAGSGTRERSALGCTLGVLAGELRVERLSGASRPSRPDPGSVI